MGVQWFGHVLALVLLACGALTHSFLNIAVDTWPEDSTFCPKLAFADTLEFHRFVWKCLRDDDAIPFCEVPILNGQFITA